MNSVSLNSPANASVWTSHNRAVRPPALWNWIRPAVRSGAVMAAETVIAAFTYCTAIFVLAEARAPSWPLIVIKSTLAILILIRAGVLVSMGLYRRSLRYAGIADVISIAKAATLSSAFFAGIVLWRFPAQHIPAAVFVMDWALLLILLMGLHFGVRVLSAEKASWRHGGKRVLLVGGGGAGMTILKELAMDPSSWRPVGVVDDDANKWGRKTYGVSILGGIADLAEIAQAQRAEEILICIPSASSSQMRQILASCRQVELPVRTLPSLPELMDGSVSRRDLRSPQIEDLLQRDAIHVDAEETRRIVGGKIILVTGAGGSIGSELCRQIADAQPRMLVLLDKSENSLFYIHREVSERLGASRVKPLLVDLVYRDRIRDVIREEQPEIIFHAAAHKHVALLERHPHEAIRNNVLGTRNVAEAALEFGVERFVNISTDKAVSPKSFLGLSKKLTEMCIQELADQRGTRFSNVRFGNVAGSTGSVLRLFWDQIQKGGPIRVTDPRATRYFMSVPEAVHLILRAAALGRGGETFVFDMGEPINILELAKTMILFAGLKPDRDVAIEFTGLNGGEKIAEDLWESWEVPVATAHNRILMIAERCAASPGILRRIGMMEAYLQIGDRDGLLAYIQEEITPTFGRGRRESTEELPLLRASAARPIDLGSLEVA